MSGCRKNKFFRSCISVDFYDSYVNVRIFISFLRPFCFQPFEEDSIKEELDLILSTSPGVVRLASFWIIRARLAAVNGNVERVICLLEQANAFGAHVSTHGRFVYFI